MAKSFLSGVKQGASKPKTAIEPVDAGELIAELERVRKEASELVKSREEANQKLAVAQQNLNHTIKSNWLVEKAREHKAVRPDHIVDLLGKKFAVNDGKVVLDGSDEDPSKFVSDWFASDGKHYQQAQIQPGASASRDSGNAPAAPPTDLKTQAGMNNYVRKISGMKTA